MNDLGVLMVNGRAFSCSGWPCIYGAERVQAVASGSCARAADVRAQAGDVQLLDILVDLVRSLLLTDLWTKQINLIG